MLSSAAGLGYPSRGEKGLRQVASTVRLCVKWFVGLALIAGLFWWYRDELSEIISQQFEWPWLAASVLVYFPSLLLTFYRWCLLVRAQELPFSTWHGFKLGFLGYLFSQVLPGSVTGDVVKAGMLARDQSRRTLAVATVIMDRIVGLFGLFLLAALLGVLFWHLVHDHTVLRILVIMVWLLAGFASLCLAALAFLPVPVEPIAKWVSRLRFAGGFLVEMMRACQLYRWHFRTVILALALSMVGHAGFVLSFYFSARAVPGPTPPLEAHYVFIPIGAVAQSVPLTPGNLGINEGVFNSLYQAWDPALKAKGALTSLAQRAVTWIVAAMVLGAYACLRGRRGPSGTFQANDRTPSPRALTASPGPSSK
ncbi:MAG: hypothetical protein C4296_01615 [Gemmataceae bacterium]